MALKHWDQMFKSVYAIELLVSAFKCHALNEHYFTKIYIFSCAESVKSNKTVN